RRVRYLNQLAAHRHGEESDDVAGIGAERWVPERQHAGVSDEHLEADHDDGIDQHLGDERVGGGGAQRGSYRRHSDHYAPQDDGSDGRGEEAFPHTRSARLAERIPSGRKMNKRAMSPKTAASVSRERELGRIQARKADWATPRARPPRTAPSRRPRPPMIAASNPGRRMSNPMSGSA